MWDEQDHFSRWVQFVCAIPLIGFGALFEYHYWTSTYVASSYRGVLGFGCLGLGIRCLWYAITGKDNVNRDDF